MTDAAVIAGTDRPNIRLERQLVDPPSVVWTALTDREQLRRWFPCDVVVAGGEWTVGAEIAFHFGAEMNGTVLAGEVLVSDEPRTLSFRWGEEILRFELTESDGGTRLVLFDELPPSTAARNAAGWDVCLDRLVGITPAPDFWQRRFDRYSTTFEPDLGPQVGAPAGHDGE
jgi:uncharacterized protein YndB with AHSA1/START domain